MKDEASVRPRRHLDELRAVFARGCVAALLSGVGLLTVNCGSSEPFTITDSDAGIATEDSGSFGPACGTRGAACTANSECCVHVCSGGSCGGGRGDGGDAKACNGAGEVCARGFDCCSGACTAGKCVGGTLGGGASDAGPLACTDVGATCGRSGDCCSGRCEPVTGQAGVIQCRDACRANGVRCVTAQDCCSLGCFNSVCAAKLCVVVGDGCGSDQECCSGVCNPSTKRCDVDMANSRCRPTGESCGSGPQSGCCGRTDKDDLCVDGRCALPPQACKGQNATCTTDAECCGKRCDPGTKTCITACAPTAGRCVTGADCCSASCTNGSCDAPLPPPVDGGDGATAPPLCLPTGSACQGAGDCCTGLCLGGFCETPPK